MNLKSMIEKLTVLENENKDEAANKAWHAGHSAGKSKQDPKKNPYSPGSEEYKAYNDGHHDGSLERKERIQEMSDDLREGSDYTPPELGTVKANLMNTQKPTVQVQVFKHNTLRGDSYWVTKEVKTFKTMDQAQAYVDRINEQGVAEGSLTDRQQSYWDNVAKEKKNKERNALKDKKAEREKTPIGKAEKYWAKEGVAEGLPQTLRKVVPGHAKREIDKKMDAGKFGKTDADKDANFQRYKKIQDKLKEQGVAEGSLNEFAPGNEDDENEYMRGYKDGTGYPQVVKSSKNKEIWMTVTPKNPPLTKSYLRGWNDAKYGPPRDDLIDLAKLEEQGVAEGIVDDMPADIMVGTMDKIRRDADSRRYQHLQNLLKKSKKPETIAQIKALLDKEFPQDVSEGFEPGHREIERWATQSEENQKIYNAYINAGKMADGAYKNKDGAAYTGLQLRKKQIRDLIAKKMSEQGVAEDLDADQKRAGQLGPIEKVKNNNIGKLVGANESLETAAKPQGLRGWMKSVEQEIIAEAALDPSQIAIPRIKPAGSTTATTVKAPQSSPSTVQAPTTGSDMSAIVIDFKNPDDPLKVALQKASQNKSVTALGEDDLDEVIDKSTTAADIIADFIKSKDSRFADKSKEERTKMALGAYYGMHPELSKKEESVMESKQAVMESTLDEVVSRYPHEHKACQEGWGMDEHLYEALCDHYFKEGRIPYKIWHGPLEELRQCVEECYMQDTNPQPVVDEGLLGGALGALGGAALAGPLGAIGGYSAGSKLGDDLDEDPDVDEGLLGMDGLNIGEELSDDYEPEIDESSMADQFMIGDTVYHRNQEAKVYDMRGDTVIVTLANGDRDVWPAREVSLTRQGFLPTLKHDVKDIGRGLKGFLTGKNDLGEEMMPEDLSQYTEEMEENMNESEEKWIQKAIKHPGALKKQLGVPADKKIPAGKLNAAAKKDGKLGQRARLAKTLSKMNESNDRDEWDSNMPGYKGDYGGASNWNRREREDDERHDLDVFHFVLVVDGVAQYQKYDDRGEAIAAGQALLKQNPGSKVALRTVRGMSEGVHDDAMAGLQRTVDFAKQHGYRVLRSPAGKVIKFVNRAIDHTLVAKVDNDGDSINVNFIDYSTGMRGNDDASYFDHTFKQAYDKLSSEQAARDQAAREQGMMEGRMVKGPGGVALDRQGNPISPKEPRVRPLTQRQQELMDMRTDKIDIADALEAVRNQGHDADHIVKGKRGYRIIDGVEVASLVATFLIRYSPEDDLGFDDERSDLATFTIIRSPKNPTKLMVQIGNSQQQESAEQGVEEGISDVKNIDPGELAGSTLGGIAGYMAGDALGGPMVGFGAAGVGSAVGGALAKEELEQGVMEGSTSSNIRFKDHPTKSTHVIVTHVPAGSNSQLKVGDVVAKTDKKKWGGFSKERQGVAEASGTNLNELSKGTLGSYVKKAAASATRNAYQYGTDSSKKATAKDPETAKKFDTANKRNQGIGKAVDRMTKQDVEEGPQGNPKIAKPKKPKITVGKFGGDDQYSWAVFIDGRPAFTGLSRGQVAGYRLKAEQGYKDAAVAAYDKAGGYNESVTEAETKDTGKGRIHKGDYGTKDSDEKAAKPKGRGRPKKDADSDTGEVNKPDWSAFGVPKKDIKLPKWKGSTTKHKMKDESKDPQMENWDRDLSKLLTEGLTVSTSTGQQGMPDSVSVSATDADAHNLLKIIQHAGLTGGVKSAGSPSSDDTAGVIAVEPVSSDEVMSNLAPEQADDGEEAFSFLKKMLGARQTASSGYSAYQPAGGCDECGSDECECDKEVDEGNAFSGAVAKAKADGIQPGEKIKVGGKEYPVKEEEATKGSKPDPLQDLKDIERASADALKDPVSPEEEEEAHSFMNKIATDMDKKAPKSESKEETCNECGGIMEEDHKCDTQELNEWANSRVGGDEEQYQTEMDFMLNIISGGLNGKKTQHKHGYRFGDNPMSTPMEQGLDINSIKRLSGIK